MTAHTILLTQPHNNLATRTWYDFETVGLAVEHIVSMFEKRLADMNPGTHHIQYSADELMKFIDSYSEFCALVFDVPTNNYIPHDKTWIKDRIISHLKRASRTTNLPRGQRDGFR